MDGDTGKQAQQQDQGSNGTESEASSAAKGRLASEDTPTPNPDFSRAELNPAFTRASAPPPIAVKVVEAQQQAVEARIMELERLLRQANDQIERGASVLERSRRRR